LQSWERDLHVARIVHGSHRIRIGETILYVVSPTRQQRFVAAEVYRDARRDAELDGALSDKELLAILVSHRLWNEEKEGELANLTKALEDLKVGLYENRLRSNARLSIRTALKKTKDEITRLETARHGLDYVTIDGLAISAKYRYLIGATIHFEDGTSYWTEGSWNQADPFIDKVMEIITYERLDESQYRELARNDPWRSIWGAKNFSGRGLFDCAAVEITDEQRNLMLWSGIYDNIREYPDCPADEIFEDNDMLDGWMIMQRRRRESQMASQEGDRIGNQKIRNADEQFIMVDSVEDARKIDTMNDEMARATKSQRMAYLKTQGEVNEVYMPDTARRISMEFTRMEQIKMRQGK
jgi:hypothetical protein